MKAREGEGKSCREVSRVPCMDPFEPQSLRTARDLFRLRRSPLSPSEEERLLAFGRWSREELEPLGFEVDRYARPRFEAHDPLGQDVGRVVLSSGHRDGLRRLYEFGVVADPLTGAQRFPFTFALMHEVAEVGFLCSVTVTLTTLVLLARYGGPGVRETMLSPLLQGGGLAQGATWATEAHGGSDLGANASVARPTANGLWELRGEKYFCSNVGAAFALVSGRLEGGPPGIRGLRLFVVPAKRSDGQANFQVRRLKDKLGTLTVPTGEVSFPGSEAHLLGGPGSGPGPVMEMLNLSRTCNAIGSAALLQRLSELAELHARRRRAFGRELRDHPLLKGDLATLRVEADAASLLALDVGLAYGREWAEPAQGRTSSPGLQLGAHVAKMVTAEQAVRGAALAMEVWGGAGYLEEFPLAKMARDALVLPIWEGGANLQALDSRELSAKGPCEEGWLKEAREVEGAAGSPSVRTELGRLLGALQGPGDETDAKARLRLLGRLRQLTLLALRAESPGPSAEYREATAEGFVGIYPRDEPRGLLPSVASRVLGGEDQG